MHVSAPSPSPRPLRSILVANGRSSKGRTVAIDVHVKIPLPGEPDEFSRLLASDTADLDPGNRLQHEQSVTEQWVQDIADSFLFGCVSEVEERVRYRS